VLIFVAFWIFASLQHLWGLNFFNSWPMILIAMGVSVIFKGQLCQSEPVNEDGSSRDTTQDPAVDLTVVMGGMAIKN
jgi:hypothetical protein